MLGSFERAVVATLLADSHAPGLEAISGDVEQYVDAQLRAMSSLLRVGVRMVAAFLSVRVFLKSGRSFDALDPWRRRASVTRWESSRLAPVRQYVRLFRSLVLFAAYERSATVAR